MKRLKLISKTVLLMLCLTLLGANIVLPITIREIINGEDRANILLLGIDTRPGEVNARSDTIILASIDNSTKKAVMVWVPRDTRIASPNKSQKINMVNQIQGPLSTCKEVGKLFGTNINHYVLTNFVGFERIIDLLGGVYMDVDINLSSSASDVYLTKGYKCLTGKEALKYVRYRGIQDGDIGRTQRQQKLMTALIKQLLRTDTIPKIPELYSLLIENVQTNISPADMLYLTGIFLKMDENNIVTQTLPGYAYIDPNSGASYWEVDRNLSLSILDSLFHGHKFEVNLE